MQKYALVFTGTDPAFSAGMDLGELRTLSDQFKVGQQEIVWDGALKGRATHRARLPAGQAQHHRRQRRCGRQWSGFLERVRLGGRVVPGANRLHRNETRHPGHVVLHLTRLVGERVAGYLLLTGELIAAQRAMAIGLVNDVVAPDELIETALGWADMIATNGPKAEATTKSLPCRFSGQATAMGMTEYVGAPHVTDETRDSLKAFFNREPVTWIPKSRADPQT